MLLYSVRQYDATQGVMWRQEFKQQNISLWQFYRYYLKAMSDRLAPHFFVKVEGNDMTKTEEKYEISGIYRTHGASQNEWV